MVKTDARSGAGFLVGFAVTLTLLLGLTTGFNLGGGGGLKYLGPRTPPDNDWFLTQASGYLEHVVLYHNIGHVLDRARAADILIFGNSRSLEGLDRHIADDYARKWGLNIFHLGMGWSETYNIQLEIVRKYDLHPKLVIINADASDRGEWDARFAPVFGDGMSKFATFAKSINYFEAIKYVVVGNARWRIDSLRDYLPASWDSRLPARFHSTVYVTYRSRKNGMWMTDFLPSTPTPLTYVLDQENCKVHPAEIANAAKVKSEFRSRGAGVLLVLVPSPRNCLNATRTIARETGLELLTAFSPGLEEHGDESHLTRESARRVSSTLFEEIEASQAFKTAFGRP